MKDFRHTAAYAKWKAFRAWQENPMRYELDKNEHVCNNCGHTFTGNYCPVCSQSARHGRITWKAIWQGIGQLWGIESRSAIYTLWQLLWRLVICMTLSLMILVLLIIMGIMLSKL